MTLARVRNRDTVPLSELYCSHCPASPSSFSFACFVSNQLLTTIAPRVFQEKEGCRVLHEVVSEVHFVKTYIMSSE